jgi:formate dehydrogenase major subunit
VVPAPGEARSDLWILDSLFRALRARAVERDRPRDRALQKARWDYQETETLAGYQSVLAEIAGWAVEPLELEGEALARGDSLPGTAWLKDDGRTACGNRLYAGLFSGGSDLSRRRGDPDPEDEDGRHEEWAWSWPDNTRILYEGGPDSPPFARTAEGVARLFAADHALTDDGQLVRRSLRPVDGPLPEHYEPVEGPLTNPLHPDVPTSPLVVHPRTPESPALGSAEEYPYILTTGFLHEMWGGGAMSRRLATLIEAQPEPFVEISRSLANRLGVRGGEMVALETPRGRVVLKVVVTGRLRPLFCDGAFQEVVWAPMHYGELGDATGAAVNAVTLDALEPNVKIQETKACRCRVVRADGSTPWEPAPRTRLELPGEGPRAPAPPRDYSQPSSFRLEGEELESDSANDEEGTS